MRRRLLIKTTILAIAVAGAICWLWQIGRRPWVSGRESSPISPGATYVRFSVQINEGRTDVRAVVLQPGNYQAMLIDQPDRNAGQSGLKRAVEEQQPLVAVNGGYFREDFSPAGLYVINGKARSPLTAHSPLSAVVGIDADGALHVRPRGEPIDNLVAALQAGPFVIDPDGRRGIGEGATARARRTLLAITDQNEVVVISTSDASLLDLAKLLQGMSALLGCARIERAVNLDGGPSTTMAVRGQPTVEAIGPVRNYLLFRRRE